jgi:hypothetical protein
MSVIPMISDRRYRAATAGVRRRARGRSRGSGSRLPTSPWWTSSSTSPTTSTPQPQCGAGRPQTTSPPLSLADPQLASVIHSPSVPCPRLGLLSRGGGVVAGARDSGPPRLLAHPFPIPASPAQGTHTLGGGWPSESELLLRDARCGQRFTTSRSSCRKETAKCTWADLMMVGPWPLKPPRPRPALGVPPPRQEGLP